MQIHNCHTHIFTNDIVPEGFLPFGLARMLSKPKSSRRIGWLLNKINPFSTDDLFDRYASFIDIGCSKSQTDIFELLCGYYPENAKFVVLMMDMEYMDAGEVKEPFEKHLDGLSAVKQKYPDKVIPFIAADPRRPNIADIVKDAVENRGFGGIKIYPALGYYPFDERFREMYAYAEAKQIPVVTHCSRGGVYYRGNITNEMLIHPRDPEWKLKKQPNEKFCDYFTDPRNYKYVLQDFPNLKICLAHFGGNDEWNGYLYESWRTGHEKSWLSVILDLMAAHPGVYTDVSYIMHAPNLHPLLKIILREPVALERVLFGTDYYMLRTETSERAFSIALRSYIGEESFARIAEKNPQTFLATV